MICSAFIRTELFYLSGWILIGAEYAPYFFQVNQYQFLTDYIGYISLGMHVLDHILKYRFSTIFQISTELGIVVYLSRCRQFVYL